MPKPKYPSESLDQYMVRMPDGMRDRIKKIAERNNRSMNAEIVSALSKWIEDEDYHNSLAEYYAMAPSEAPPEGYETDDGWEPPSEDTLLDEKERQLVTKAANEAARRLMAQLVAAGMLPKKKSDD